MGRGAEGADRGGRAITSMNLDELRSQSEIVQRHIDTISNLLALATITQNPNQLRAVKLLMERESLHMQSESDKLSEMMSAFKEERTTMKRTALVSAVLVILMFVLVAGLPVVAQDSPLATNTPAVVTIQTVEASVNDFPVEATLVAPVEQPPVVEVPVSDNTIYVIGFLVMLVIVGTTQYIATRQTGALLATINTALSNKQVMDEARQHYMESSLQVQEIIKLMTGLAGIIGNAIPGQDLAEVVADFGEKVIMGETTTLTTDGAIGASLQPRRDPYPGSQPGYPPRDPASFLTQPEDGGGVG